MICISLYFLVNTTIFSLMCVTTLHVSAFCVGHHQVCLEVKSYNCMVAGEVGLLVGEGEISLCGFSYYVMHYVILVLVLLMLRWHKVFRASAYMMKTAYSRNICTLLNRPCLYRSALY